MLRNNSGLLSESVNQILNKDLYSMWYRKEYTCIYTNQKKGKLLYLVRIRHTLAQIARIWRHSFALQPSCLLPSMYTV